MASRYRIPKQSDREIIAALGRITHLLAREDAKIRMQDPIKGWGDVSLSNPESDPKYQAILMAEGQSVPSFKILLQNHPLLEIARMTEEFSDVLVVAPDNFGNAGLGTDVYVQFLTLARRELLVSELESSLQGSEKGSQWAKLRNSQANVLQSLNQAAENLISKAAENNLEIERERSQRFGAREQELRAELDREREKLHQEYSTLVEQLAAKELALDERAKGFETKESHYVARQKRDQQTQQIEAGLRRWGLTAGTTKKRLPIHSGYVLGMLGMVILESYFVVKGFGLFNSVDDFAKLAWWQWILLSLKTFAPLAGFITFLTYYIRWNSAWAQRHADEEFRHRALLIDIGRSSWLLEAVRDAQERKAEIPADLLKGLSRNLFAHTTSVEQDLHPNAFSDVLLQGLSSLRVKSPDGSEVEATRGKRGG